MVNPIISITFRNSLPGVGSTLRIRSRNGALIVRITRRVNSNIMEYVVLTTSRNLRGSVRIITANNTVSIPINRGYLNELFGMANRAVSKLRSLSNRRR